jgi:hypothetical protein
MSLNTIDPSQISVCLGINNGGPKSSSLLNQTTVLSFPFPFLRKVKGWHSSSAVESAEAVSKDNLLSLRKEVSATGHVITRWSR